jgi:hypothetical protein
VPVAIFLAAAVILGGIIVVAMGKGGELSRQRPELPARTDFRSWSDVADYRPPAALLGYHPVATERALALIARTIAERDAEIDWLRQRLAEVQPERPGADQADMPAIVPLVAPGAADLRTADPGAADLRAADLRTADPRAAAARAAAPEPVSPAEVRWQAGGGSASDVGNGFSARLPVSQGLGDDE